MNKEKITTILFAVLLLATTGCKKWLDVSPKTQVRERVLLETEQGYKDALIGVYIHLAGAPNGYGNNLTMGMLDAMGQRYNTSSTSHSFYRASRYEYTDVNVKTNITGIWANLYTGIANINNILTQIEEHKAVFTGNTYHMVKGEALALRAYVQFDLVRLFGVAPIVDGSRKAVPYPTTFGNSVYPLLTVNEVLDKCVEDLNQARELLSVDKTVRTANVSDNFRAFTRNRMNYWAVKGLEARLWLYRGDKEKAMAAALEVINSGGSNFPFVSNVEASRTTNRDRTYALEHLFALSAYRINDVVNNWFKVTTVNGTPTLFTSQSAINTLFETTSGGSSDIRFNYLYTLYGSGYSTTKFWQDDIVQNAGTEYLRNVVPMIRISELYYIAAECSNNPVDGVGYLNSVRINRGLNPLSTGISAPALETEILKEYKKEMYGEGQLFYHFKRRNTARVDGSSINMSDATWAFPLPEDEVEFGKRY